MASDEQRSMSDARLSELREHCEEARYAAENGDDMEYDDPVILWQQFASDLTDALAEIDRQRAFIAQAVTMARVVDGQVEQMRAEADHLRRELSTAYALLDEHHIQR